MKDAQGRLVHRFTDSAADEREQRREAAEAKRVRLAEDWAKGATDDELRAIFEDGDANPNATKFARRGAALREMRARSGQ